MTSKTDNAALTKRQILNQRPEAAANPALVDHLARSLCSVDEAVLALKNAEKTKSRLVASGARDKTPRTIDAAAIYQRRREAMTAASCKPQRGAPTGNVVNFATKAPPAVDAESIYRKRRATMGQADDQRG